MLLALDFLVQWPPLTGVGNSQQTQYSHGSNGPHIYRYNAESYISTNIPLIWYFTVQSVINFSGSADTQFVSSFVSDCIISGECDEAIVKCYGTAGGLIDIDETTGASYSFVSAKEERGGRGAYTERRIRRQAQPHIYSYQPYFKDGILAFGEAETAYVKHVKFGFLSTLTSYEVVYDVTSLKTPDPIVYNYLPVVVNNNIWGYGSYELYDNSKVLRDADDELIVSMLLDDDNNNGYYITSLTLI